MSQKTKTRCNMYLNSKNVQTVKSFIEGTGLTLSSYIDLFIGMAAENIEAFSDEYGGNIFEEKDGKRYLDIYTAYKVLGIFDMGGMPITLNQVKKIESGKLKIDFERKENIDAIKNMKTEK